MPYDPDYSLDGLPYAPVDPHWEYNEAVRRQAEEEEARRYGEVHPDWGRDVPGEFRQPSWPGRRPLYHRDRPDSPEDATGHRSASPAPYIPARLMKDVQKHYQNDTSPLSEDSMSGFALQAEKDEQVDYLLQRIRESRQLPPRLFWDQGAENPML